MIKMKLILENLYKNRLLKEFPMPTNGKLKIEDLNNLNINKNYYNTYKNNPVTENLGLFDGLDMIYFQSSNNEHNIVLLGKEYIEGVCNYGVEEDKFIEHVIWKRKDIIKI